MFELDKYLADLITNCRSAFGERLLYMGLQGSWLRGEAHENSDIDIIGDSGRVLRAGYGYIPRNSEGNRFLREILRYVFKVIRIQVRGNKN